MVSLWHRLARVQRPVPGLSQERNTSQFFNSSHIVSKVTAQDLMSLLLVVCDQGQLMDEAVEPSCISLLDMDLHDVFVLEASF